MELKDVELYAWVGEDELGSGEIGLKQAEVPAGCIALVSVRDDRLDADYIKKQLQMQANAFGKTIRLCKFSFKEEIIALEPQ